MKSRKGKSAPSTQEKKFNRGAGLTVMKSRKGKSAPSTQEKKFNRGPTVVKSVIRARRKGIKFEVGWNTKGQPINPNGPKLVSYIGATVRQMVPITCDNWRDSALDVFKNSIWVDIQMSFVVDESRRKYVLQKGGSLHRSFRTSLTKHYLRDANGNVNDHPPKKYAHIISEDVWRAFVAKRTEDDSFQKLSKENRQRAASSQVYPYRKSRKGYAGLEQDMLLQETGSGLTSIQRHILWKNARVNKAGVIDNENVQQVWDKCVCHENLSQFVSEGEIQDGGRQDILGRVFNVPEHPGRVRAVGFGVSQKDYFPPQKRPKHANASEMQSLRETLEQLMCKADYLENKLQQKEVERQPDLASPSAKDSCTRASYNLSEDYPEVAKLKEKGLRNSSDVDIHFKDTLAIATSCCAWAPSEDSEEDGGSDTNRTHTLRTDERYVQDVGVQGKENEGVEDLATYPSPSSDMPKRKRVGKGDKGGSVGHRMRVQGKEYEVGDTNRTDTPTTDERYIQDVGVQGKEYEGVENLAAYSSPSSERPKRKRVGKADKGGSVGHRMCVQGKEYEGVEDLATYSNPSGQRPKRERVGKGDKGGSVGHRMCEQSDRIIESLNNENNVTSGNITNAPPTLADCLDMLKQLPGLKYGGETHIIGIRLMKSESNREIFALLNDPILQLNWIKSHTLADVSRL